MGRRRRTSPLLSYILVSAASSSARLASSPPSQPSTALHKSSIMARGSSRHSSSTSSASRSLSASPESLAASADSAAHRSRSRFRCLLSSRWSFCLQAPRPCVSGWVEGNLFCFLVTNTPGKSAVCFLSASVLLIDHTHASNAAGPNTSHIRIHHTGSSAEVAHACWGTSGARRSALHACVA